MKVEVILILVELVFGLIFHGSTRICNGNNPNYSYPAPKRWHIVSWICFVVLIINTFLIFLVGSGIVQFQ